MSCECKAASCDRIPERIPQEEVKEVLQVIPPLPSSPRSVRRPPPFEVDSFLPHLSDSEGASEQQGQLGQQHGHQVQQGQQGQQRGQQGQQQGQQALHQQEHSAPNKLLTKAQQQGLNHFSSTDDLPHALHIRYQALQLVRATSRSQTLLSRNVETHHCWILQKSLMKPLRRRGPLT